MANFTLPTDPNVIMDNLTEWGAAAGQVGETMLSAWIKKQAESAPGATCVELGATTDEQKAWVAMKIASGAGIDMGNTSNQVVPPKSSTRTAKARPTSKLTPAQEAALQAHVASTMAQKANTSINTRIPTFYVARPTSDQYIDEGTKGKLKTESWKSITDKIAAGEYVVVDDFTDKDGKSVLSKSNYDILVQAAAANAESIPVMRNDKVGPAIGYNVAVADAPNQNPTAEIYTKAALQHFVEMKAAGYIKADENTMGVQLRQITSKSNDAQQADTKRVILSDTNKKAAVQAKNYTSIRAVSPTMEKKSQKADLVFYVNKKTSTVGADGKRVVGTDLQKDKKGNVRRFAIRATVECNVHALELLKEYEGIFPSGKVDPKKPLDGEQLKKVAEATVQDLAITLSDRNSTLVVDQRLQEALAELQGVIGGEQAAPGNVSLD